MEPIQLFGEKVTLELPGSTPDQPRTFDLPMPTAWYDINEIMLDAVKKASEASIKAQDEAEAAGTDIPPETFYTDRDWLLDIIEYVRTATTVNGTPGVELTESQASQLRNALPVMIAKAKKKLNDELGITQT